MLSEFQVRHAPFSKKIQTVTAIQSKRLQQSKQFPHPFHRQADIIVIPCPGRLCPDCTVAPGRSVTALWQYMALKGYAVFAELFRIVNYIFRIGQSILKGAVQKGRRGMSAYLFITRRQLQLPFILPHMAVQKVAAMVQPGSKYGIAQDRRIGLVQRRVLLGQIP